MEEPEMFDIEPIQPSQAVMERNEARVGDGEPCVVCRKAVNTKTAKWVHMSEAWKIYPASVSVEDAADLPQGTMYTFPVGPECAKKIPKEYLQS